MADAPVRYCGAKGATNFHFTGQAKVVGRRITDTNQGEL
jgi:hypothetical protein